VHHAPPPPSSSVPPRRLATAPALPELGARPLSPPSSSRCEWDFVVPPNLSLYPKLPGASEIPLLQTCPLFSQKKKRSGNGVAMIMISLPYGVGAERITPSAIIIHSYHPRHQTLNSVQISTSVFLYYYDTRQPEKRVTFYRATWSARAWYQFSTSLSVPSVLIEGLFRASQMIW
jgi:hypothetical protein